jgi:hypothetical protein
MPINFLYSVDLVWSKPRLYLLAGEVSGIFLRVHPSSGDLKDLYFHDSIVDAPSYLFPFRSEDNSLAP